MNPADDAQNIAIVKEYFRRPDAGRADLLDLMAEDVQLYFPKFGVASGRKSFGEMARRGQPEDVAELMAFLVSAAGSYFVGAEFTIDGGVVT